MTHRVHIIGAGLIGLSTADSLMDRGREVVIWDRGPAPGLGASYLNGAMLHPSQAAPWIIEGLNDDLSLEARERLTREGLELSARSGARLHRRMAELGLDARRHGVLQVFGSKIGRDRRMAAYARLGVRVEATDWLGHPAVDIPDDSTADASRYALRLAQDLAERGAEFRMSCAIRLDRSPDGVIRIHHDEGDWQGEGASFARAPVCAPARASDRPPGAEDVDQLVVAAGHATAALLEPLLRPLGLELDVEAVTGHALRFRRGGGVAPVTVMDAVSRTALTVLDDEVRLSGGVGLSEPRELLPIWNALAGDLVKSLGDPVRAWTGQRPATRSGRARMGSTPIPGLFVNTGHAHMGWTLSAGAGEIVAETLVGEREHIAIAG